MQHLYETAVLATVFAEKYGMDRFVAYVAACFHDIGKASPIFQKRLFIKEYDPPYRHEIGSLFFISLLPKELRDNVLEALVAHHKSIYISLDELNSGYAGRGIIDLEDNYGDEVNFNNHIIDFDNWKVIVIDILKALNIPLVKTDITIEEAKKNYYDSIKIVSNYENEFSKWRGLLNTADHLSSALVENTHYHIPFINSKINLSYYFNRPKSELYPLSNIESVNDKKHTLVVASTGAGKTDFLLKRCIGRVVYILPFQASINAMYKRIKKDISLYNPFANIGVQHASSKIVIDRNNIYECSIQGKAGYSLKVMTPQQIVSIVVGTKGFESLILDLMNCDVILDEVHVYSGKMQRILFKLIEVLKSLNWRIQTNQSTTYSPMPTIALAVSDNANHIATAIRGDLVTDSSAELVIDGSKAKMFASDLVRGYVLGFKKENDLDEAEEYIYNKIMEFDFEHQK